MDHPIWNSKIYKILYSFEYSIFYHMIFFLLFAGGCITATSVNSGAFTFAVSDLPSLMVWNLGSAKIFYSLLVEAVIQIHFKLAYLDFL